MPQTFSQRRRIVADRRAAARFPRLLAAHLLLVLMGWRFWVATIVGGLLIELVL